MSEKGRNENGEEEPVSELGGDDAGLGKTTKGHKDLTNVLRDGDELSRNELKKGTHRTYNCSC